MCLQSPTRRQNRNYDFVETYECDRISHKFPCPWRNKTFKIYDKDGNSDFEFSFSGDGQTNNYSLALSAFSLVLHQNRCYQITERFIITRVKDTDDFECFGIFYDIDSPLKFQYQTAKLNSFDNSTEELTDIQLCDICPGKLSEIYEAHSRNIYACNLPSTCTSGTSTLCNMNDIIPRGCAVTTTESPTTTTEQTTTTSEAETTKEPTKTTKRSLWKEKHQHTK
ncbi:unnamed protein product [Mytilus edulis]|uniref:Uncharacterized protein n=1 Tax=Mytilus edulis TaxID=6550 RepID=A0A8S3TXY7_MYTED|nr:unnamed protein product [Mytilus edulis]